MMWVSDAAGAIQFVNKMFREFAGATAEQVDSGKWQLTVHPDDAPAYVGAFAQAVMARGRFRAEARVQRFDGEWRWFGSNGEPRLSATGEFLGHIGVCADITRRRQTEQAMLDARQFAQSTIDTLSSLICVLDEAGRIIAANQAWKEFGRAHGWGSRGEHDLAGLPDAQFGMGLYYRSLCPAEGECSGLDDADQYEAGIRQVLNGERQEYSMEYSCRGPDKQSWYIVRFTRFLNNGVPRIVAAHTDISELKQSARALAESEEKFRQLAENVREIFFVLSATTGETLYVSPAFERVWGRSCESLYQRPSTWEEARWRARTLQRNIGYGAVTGRRNGFEAAPSLFGTPAGRWFESLAWRTK
jgi:PAS domain S-box-containing protein